MRGCEEWNESERERAGKERREMRDGIGFVNEANCGDGEAHNNNRVITRIMVIPRK